MSECVPNDTPAHGGKANALLIRKMHEWERRFLDCCNKEDSLAKRAFERLEQAGLGGACRKLLWEYSEGQGDFAEIQRGTELIIRNIQAFRRAEREEQRRVNDPRAHMFRQRREAAARVLAQTPWPLRNPNIPTFGDLARAYRSPYLFDLRKIRAMVGRSKLSYMLAILRVGARAHGVDLSGNEIAALVYCASGQELDGGAVRRFLRESWIAAAEPGFRIVFDNFLASAR